MRVGLWLLVCRRRILMATEFGVKVLAPGYVGVVRFGYGRVQAERWARLGKIDGVLSMIVVKSVDNGEWEEA